VGSSPLVTISASIGAALKPKVSKSTSGITVSAAVGGVGAVSAAGAPASVAVSIIGAAQDASIAKTIINERPTPVNDAFFSY